MLREARAAIRMVTPTACEVALSLTVDGGVEVAHRLDSRPGTHVVLDRVDGATVTAPPAEIGVTRAFTVRPGAGPYSIRYRVELPASREYHCPIWLPAVPADGRSRAVVVAVTLPDGAVAAGTMPAFRWTGSTGIATTAHLPAFVVVPFGAVGAPRPWDVARAMDALTLGTLALATLLWWRRTRARRSVSGRATA